MDLTRESQPQTTVISMDVHGGDGGGAPAIIDTGPMQCVYEPDTVTGDDTNFGSWSVSDKKNLVDDRGERQLTRDDVEEEVRRINRRNHIIIAVSTVGMGCIFALTIFLVIKFA